MTGRRLVRALDLPTTKGAAAAGKIPCLDSNTNLTGATFTNATLVTPTFSGASSGGTFTGATITGATITGSTISGTISPNVVSTSSALTANANATLANVVGLVQTVVPGTYKFTCMLPSTVASGTGGIQYAFNYTTAVLSSIEATSQGFTASAVTVQHTTTTTTQTPLYNSATVTIFVQIEGSFVVTTGGTVQVQMAQSVSNASNTVALVGGTFACTRIA